MCGHARKLGGGSPLPGRKKAKGSRSKPRMALHGRVVFRRVGEPLGRSRPHARGPSGPGTSPRFARGSTAPPTETRRERENSKNVAPNVLVACNVTSYYIA